MPCNQGQNLDCLRRCKFPRLSPNNCEITWLHGCSCWLFQTLGPAEWWELFNSWIYTWWIFWPGTVSYQAPDGMAEWLRRETSKPGILGSNSAQVSDCPNHPAWSGRVPWSLCINVRDYLLFYNSCNSLRLMLLVITCKYKQINFTFYFFYFMWQSPMGKRVVTH